MNEQEYFKKLDIKPLIISRSRYDTIGKDSCSIFPDYFEVLVPESEKELYQARIDNPIITVPDSIQGLGRLRNWILDHFSEQTIIMLDDDIRCMYYLAEEKSKRILDDEKVAQILINTSVISRDMGVKVFGYSQTDIRKFNGSEPFKLNTWVGTVIGVNGRKYRFRDDKFKVDIDYTLQSLLVDRIIFQDMRYLFSTSRDNNRGGNATFRNMADYEKSLETLKKKWGACLRVKNHKTSNININLNVPRKAPIKVE